LNILAMVKGDETFNKLSMEQEGNLSFFLHNLPFSGDGSTS
jgi:hypothetical protein